MFAANEVTSPARSFLLRVGCEGWSSMSLEQQLAIPGAGRVRGVGAASGGERAGALRAGGQALGVDGEPDAGGGGVVLRVPGHGNELARDLVVRTRSGRGAFKPFLHGIARDRPRGRPVRLPERQRLRRTLSLEQIAGVIDCQLRLRDRFLFALLASTGMRVGQALGLRHEDIVSWERRIEIVPREGSSGRARSKGGARGSVPVPGELIRLWSDYMHEEYGAVESDFVFVNLWKGEIGRPLSYSSVDELVRRTRELVGFHFTVHQLRHTFATLAYRDGVALEVIGPVLTHGSPSSTLIYTHLTAEDLRRVLADRGVLDRVADLLL
jgi:integrase/recombinase XerD